LINQCVQQLPYYQVWVTVPLADWNNNEDDDANDEDEDPSKPSSSAAAAAAAESSAVVVATGGGRGASESPWTRWDRLRRLCEHSQALFVALELGPDLPDDLEQAVSRWEAEPVKVLLVPVASFVTNKKGFPVLGKKHQVRV
jgi:hypothetical protein